MFLSSRVTIDSTAKTMTPKKNDPWTMRLNGFMENVRADT